MKPLCIFQSADLAGRGLLFQIPALEEDFTVKRSLLPELLITSDQLQSFRLYLLSESCEKAEKSPRVNSPRASDEWF